MPELTQAQIDAVLERIRATCDEVGECNVWTGYVNKNKGLAMTNVNLIPVYLTKFVWLHAHPESADVPTTHYCATICGNKLCLNPEHIALLARKQEFNVQKAWEIIEAKGKRLENGCFVAEEEYPSLSINGKVIAYHRLSYMMKMNISAIPMMSDDGEVKMMVRHKCNNPCCFEPDHLELGTQYQNDYDDKIEAGTLQRGEKHYNAQVSEELAREIKLSKPDPGQGPTQKERAAQFGVSLDTVRDIDCSRSWSHLPDKNGEIVAQDVPRRVKARELRKKAKARVWDDMMFATAQARLAEKLTIAAENNKYAGSPCHEWTGMTNKAGYGRIVVLGREFMTHILAAAISQKAHVVDGQIVRHKCGNTQCCRGDHLQIGTSAENAQDTLAHGRCHFAKLDSEKVLEIKQLLHDGILDKNQIAEQSGVTYETIKSIANGKSWKHVQLAEETKESAETSSESVLFSSIISG